MKFTNNKIQEVMRHKPPIGVINAMDLKSKFVNKLVAKP